MPHDSRGILVEKGQRVIVQMIVDSVDPGEEFCNCTLKIDGEHGPNNVAGSLTLNTKQIRIVPPGFEPKIITASV
jgi:hypothetical protein